MRIRSIKPEFWSDTKVARWDTFTRLLYIGLWSVADDYGCGTAEPAIIAASLFPFDLSRNPEETLRQVNAAITTLSQSGRISLYTVGDEAFFHVLHWREHQRVDRPSKSRIPRPEEGVEIPPPKPQAAAPEPPKADAEVPEAPEREVARGILSHLNEKADRSFRPTDNVISAIVLRLADVANDADGVKQMIDRQCACWKGTDMEEYLRPETLFRKGKFNAYYDDRTRPITRRGPAQPHRTGNQRNEGLAGLDEWERERIERLSRSSGEEPPPGS